ncbi:MAG: PAS domain-containing protein, partial [Hyphomicrobiaceae bacterium]|nr:PAS domain-containing protein [Hyphomicrobiaceae bacterium]
PDRAEPFVLGLLAILAVIGVITLLAGAIGLVRFAGRGQEDSLGKDVVDAMGDGLVVTGADGRIVYANQAYAALTGATDARDVRSLERLFLNDDEAAKAIYRISGALREGHAAEDEVRMPVPLDGNEGGGARWYRISARVLPQHGRRKALTAWTVADVSRERARQEAVFQDLQHAIDYLDHAPAGFFSAEPDGRIVYLNA